MKMLVIHRSVRLITGTGLLLSILACTSLDPRPETTRTAMARPADLILRGGRVVTVDPKLLRTPAADAATAAETPEAVAVRGAEIVAVGTNAQVEGLLGPETEVVELDGRLLIPGFIEGHGHFMSLGDALMILDLTAASSWEEIVARVAQAVADSQPGAWIRGRGWHQEKWQTPPHPAVDGSPVHASLSAVSPENPVLLTHASGHAAFANGNALRLAGLGRDSADPPGGKLVRDESGELTGLLRETAQRPVAAAFQRAQEGLSPVELERMRRQQVELAGREALSKGVTSFHDAGSSFETIDFFRRLETENALPVRLYVMVRDGSNDEMDQRLAEYRSEHEGNDFLAVRSIKRQIDGALGSHGAWLLEPYEDMPESTGLVLEPEDDIRKTAELAIRHGYQVNTHAIGDQANRRVLDIYEEAFRGAGGGADRRWRIEHAQHIDPADLDRFAELGVIASMQGIHCTSDGPWVAKRLGQKRTEAGAYVWRRLLDRGVVISNGTDVPVEDIDPIASFYASVSRRTSDGNVFFGEQRMSREEALASYTVNNAYAAFEEDHKGTLEVGKLADLVVLSKDILTIAEDQIPEARVDLTILGGKVVYRRADP